MWTPKRRVQQKMEQQKAEAALAESTADLARTRVRSNEARHIADRLRKIQDENHFAESLRIIYGGR